MAYIVVDPKVHRTDQRGTRIICPIKQKGNVYRVEPLDHKATRTFVCPICRAALDAPVQMLDARRRPTGEFQWRITAAA